MRKSLKIFFFVALSTALQWPACAAAQSGNGSIVGTVTDADGDVLPGAEVKLIQSPFTVTTNSQGQFVVTNILPGSYTVTATYLGFNPKSTDVTLAGGQTVTANLVLDVATQNDVVVVTAGRSYGEAESINQTRASDTLINILPAAVITSLPNANVADAIGRLPGVTLERDEGEGKYVQIRGTEPRLSNLTIDGVVLPSPEGGVRQVKLDTIPAGIIQSVEINKTLLPNMDADAIGGSVNLVTKTAPERPTVTLYGNGGFTPIINKVPVTDFGGTVGQRFGEAKRIGVIVSGSYDYNGRGIDDIEPTPGILSGATLTPAFSAAAIRQYRYTRSRYGFGGGIDYKLNDTSLIYVRGLYSEFFDNGRRWEYAINDNGGTQGANVPSFTTEARNGDYQVGNILVGGNHVFTNSWVNWGVSISRSQLLNPLNGGESKNFYNSTLTTSNCQYDPGATTNFYLPQFTPACFSEAYNPSQMQLTQIEDAAHGKASQLNLAASISVARNYHLGSHFSTFEMGFKIRNAHKFDNSYEIDYSPVDQTTAPLMRDLLSGFTNTNYYGGHYQFGPAGSWDKAVAFLKVNPGQFVLSATQNAPKGGNNNNFDLVERVTAGYLMNTIDFGRFRLIAGIRFEGTDDKTVSFDQNDFTGGPNGTLSKRGGGSYITPLPSASLRYRIDNSSDVRVIYSRALSRPDPQTLTTSISVDTSTTPTTITQGNNALTPEHANNYDLLYERYLTPLGLVQAGFFYKQITNTVVNVLTNGTPTTCPPGFQTPPPSGGPPCLLSTSVNAGSAHVTGFEVAFQQHFAYLPGLLSGLGVSANYSYAASQANNIDPLRTDSPALLRQAPNTWNISPTYDRGRLSVRLGMSYNDANIYSYFYQNLQYVKNLDGTNSTNTMPNEPPGGKVGPSGDVYLYSHFQVDLQGSFRIRHGLDFVASGLNLNNEVFGFYMGSNPFWIQREYYKPTYSFGFRWDPFAGRR